MIPILMKVTHDHIIIAYVNLNEREQIYKHFINNLCK